MKLARVEVVGVVRGAALDGEVLRLGGATVFETVPAGAAEVPVSAVRLLAPVAPSKVLGIGYNYRSEDEAGEQAPATPSLMFVKPPSAVVGPEERIVRPRGVSQLIAEAELAVVIGTMCRRADEDEARRAIVGYTCLNDVTAWDLYTADLHGQFVTAKAPDSFCPLGPVIATDIEPGDGLRMTCRVNGELRQEGTTSGYRAGPAAAVSHLSRLCTLEPGDVVTLGSPPRPPAIVPGDVVEVGVEGIGTLRNRVVAEDDA